MKKQSQLGMNPGTASHRLVKDLLFSFALQLGHKCFRCQQELKRESFTIEHKEAWLDSENPAAMFFDLENIAFSHAPCNFSAARKANKASDQAVRVKTNKDKNTIRMRRNYTSEARATKYRETGH